MKTTVTIGWRYALTLVVLLALAAIAVYKTITYIEYHPQLQGVKDVLSIVNLMLLALSMGFLFLSGALGLWGIRHAAEAESRRRIGLLVDAMDYVTDGVVAIDKRGRVVGSNPMARDWSRTKNVNQKKLEALFPSLTTQEVALLCDKTQPREVEVACPLARGGSRTLRFRSEPARGLNQVLISDISERHAQLLRERQAAHLQLAGRIARGVAQDFNNILCVVTGHASMIQQRAGLEGDTHSAEAILDAARRGGTLAKQLVELSRADSSKQHAAYPGEHVRRASERLRESLGTDWDVSTDVEPNLGQVPFTGIQIEQIIINLGMLLSSENPQAQKVSVHLSREEPQRHNIILLVTANRQKRNEGPGVWQVGDDLTNEKGGVIRSVILAMIEDVGGELHVCRNEWDERGYRVLMPGVETRDVDSAGGSEIPEELMNYMSNWSILLASPNQEGSAEINQKLVAVGMNVEYTQDLVGALAAVEKSDHSFNGIILDSDILGEEAEVMLRAVLKLQPTAGVVLLAQSTGKVPHGLENELVCTSPKVSAGIFNALVRARELAGQRHAQAA